MAGSGASVPPPEIEVALWGCGSESTKSSPLDLRTVSRPLALQLFRREFPQRQKNVLAWRIPGTGEPGGLQRLSSSSSSSSREVSKVFIRKEKEYSTCG